MFDDRRIDEIVLDHFGQRLFAVRNRFDRRRQQVQTVTNFVFSIRIRNLDLPKQNERKRRNWNRSRRFVTMSRPNRFVFTEEMVEKLDQRMLTDVDLNDRFCLRTKTDNEAKIYVF